MGTIPIEVEPRASDHEAVVVTEGGRSVVEWNNDLGLGYLFPDVEVHAPALGVVYPKMRAETANMLYSLIAGFGIPLGAQIVAYRASRMDAESISLGHVLSMSFGVMATIWLFQQVIPITIDELGYAYENKISWVGRTLQPWGSPDVGG